jgi:hypothetical protein
MILDVYFGSFDLYRCQKCKKVIFNLVVYKPPPCPIPEDDRITRNIEQLKLFGGDP